MARVRSRSRVYPQMFLQIVRPMESLLADLARVRLVLLMFLHVPQTVILPDKLRSTIVASVRSNIPVRVHVSSVVAVSVKRRAALVALERFGAPRSVGPLMQLQIPLGAEGLGADLALVRSFSIVHSHVHRQRASQIDTLANRALHVLHLSLSVWNEPSIVSSSHMSRETRHMNKSLVTISASLRFLVVSLLVPGKLLLGMKNFAAMTDVILEFFLDVEMVSVLVLGEIGVSSESFVAEVAFNRGVSSVTVHVLVEFLFGQERFIAGGARERFDPQVPLHVKFEVLLAVEILTALAALQGVDLEVTVEKHD